MYFSATKYCLGIAVARAIDRLETLDAQERKRLEQRWVRLNEHKPRTSADCWEKAKKLLRDAGINKEKDFDMEDVRLLQTFLRGKYQLLVLNREHDAQPIFSGEYVDRRNVIGLLYDDHHFELIFSLPAFMGTHFYCTLCHKRSSSERLHYKCPLKCTKCLADDCPKVGSLTITCAECGVVFELQDCYDRHKQMGNFIVVNNLQA